MKALPLEGQWVLVTGASSGLGKAMAELLAREHRANLVVAARREDRLQALKADLEPCGVKVEVVAADLAKLEDTDRLLARAMEGRQLAAAVLNAGVTHFGAFDELSWDDFDTMLNTNVRSVVRMTHALVPHLEKLPEGGAIELVSSLSGMIPVAYQTAYSATKAFTINFGTCMWHELQGRNVSMTTYAPPGIVTEMTAGKRFEPLRGWLIPLEKAARDGVDALRARKYMHIPGVRDRWGTAFLRALPHSFVTGRLAAVYRDALDKTRA